MDTNDHIGVIVARKLSGEASMPELKDLQEWLEADPANSMAYDQMMKIWEKGAVTLPQHQFNTASAWAAVDENISRLSSKRKAAVISLPWVKRSIAAAVILIILAGGWFIWSSNNVHWQTFAATDSNKTFTLPDGSSVLLRKGGSLDAPAEFKADKREVRLIGEAFFKVQHDASHPFEVNTNHSIVTVLGTSFLVNSTFTYDKVLVVTGKVHVKSKENPENQVTLLADEDVFLSNKLNTTGKVTNSNYLSWNTGTLNFKNAPLFEVLDEIEDYYSVQLEIAPDQAASTALLKLTVRFDNQPLDQVLDELRLLTGMQTRKENNNIIFYKK